MTLRRSVFLAFAILVGAGCADLPSAAEIEASAEGVYVLRQVSGRGLPATFRENQLITVIVEADTLVLHGDGTGVHISVSRIEDRGTGAITSESARRAEPIRYWMRGTAYRADFLCPPNADCIGGPHWLGIMAADGIRMAYFAGGTAPLWYERTRICISCKETG